MFIVNRVRVLSQLERSARLPTHIPFSLRWSFLSFGDVSIYKHSAPAELSTLSLAHSSHVSTRKASIGSNRAAFHAGKSPERVPAAPEAASAPRIANNDKYVGKI